MQKIMPSFLLAVCMAVTTPPCNESSQKRQPAPSDSQPARRQEILVKFKSAAHEDSIQALTAASGLVQVRALKAIGVRVYRVPAGQSVDEMIKKLQADSTVEYAEPNLEYRIPEKQQ